MFNSYFKVHVRNLKQYESQKAFRDSGDYIYQAKYGAIKVIKYISITEKEETLNHSNLMQQRPSSLGGSVCQLSFLKAYSFNSGRLTNFTFYYLRWTRMAN